MTNLLYKLIYIFASAIGILTLFFSGIDLEEISVLGFLIQLLIVGVISFCIGELMCISRIIRAVVSVVATGWMAVCMITGHPINKIFVVVAFLLILLTVTEEIQIRWKKQGHVDRKGHVVFVAPFIFLIMLFVLITPAPDEPYDWGLAKKIYEVVTDALEGLIDSISELFTGEPGRNPAETTIGFSERGDILGSVGGGDKKAITVSGLSTYVDQIRLSGQTFSDFDGKRWVNSDKSTAHATLIDTISMCASIDDFTDMDNDYARRTYVKVDYDKINTDHVFMPLKSVPDNYSLQTDKYREEGGNILWPEARSSGSMYALSYYIMNTDNAIIDEYMDSAKAPTEKSYNIAEKRLNINRLDGCSYSDYLSYVDHVKERYSDAPKLSPKLRTYLDELFKGAKNDYEKMKRLESSLRELTYDLSPGPLPDRIKDPSDFLDHFLLESKKGFCTHFATAFVLLARAEGLPARYVQGYMTNTDGRTSISVKSADAHAWPEVYFEGAGWVSFEPTASLSAGHSYWKTGAEKDVDKNPLSDNAVGKSGDGMEEGFFSQFSFEWYMIVIPVISGLIFIIIILILARLISASRFKKMGDDKKLVALCRQNLRILRLYGLEIRLNETLHEYKCRLMDAGIDSTGFLDHYEKYLYREEVADGAVECAKADKTELIKKLKEENKWGYIRYLV